MKFILLLLAAFATTATAVTAFNHQDVVYMKTDEGRLYSDKLHTAFFNSQEKVWAIGPVVKSQELKPGSYVWMPDQDFSPQLGDSSGSGNTMRVVQIMEHNVTVDAPNCCVGVSVSFPHFQCKAEACCGSSCCC